LIPTVDGHDAASRLVRCNGRPDGGAAATQQLLKRGIVAAGQLTAIFAFNDQMAIGAIGALQRAGRRVPENILVVGFENIPQAAAIFPADHGRPANRGDGEDRSPALARSHRTGAIEGSRTLSAGTAFVPVGRPGEHGTAKWGGSRESGVGSSRREGVAVAAMSASPASISDLRPRTSDSRGRWAGQAVRPGRTTRWRVGSDNGGCCGKEYLDIFGSAT
jgi:hypothetical protein